MALWVDDGMQGAAGGNQGLGSRTEREDGRKRYDERRWMGAWGLGQDGGAGQGAGRGGKGSRVGAERTFWEVGEVSAVHCGGRNCLPASVSSFPLSASCSV